MKDLNRIFRLALAFVIFLSPVHIFAQEKVIRILAIGNSFSMDAVEENLCELAAAAGIECEIGNLYIGGCSLERHVENIRGDAADYEYRKIEGPGVRTVRPGVSVSEALHDGKWDFVSVQQVSQLSGMFETYESLLPELVDYVKSICPESQIIFHQTWAYSSCSTHPGFANYGNDQLRMYEAIAETSRRVQSTFGIGCVVPSGTAIQNARQTSLGDNLDRDGYHLNALGRYAAACAWFGALFGADVRDNSYFNPDIDEESQRIVRLCAYEAVANPFMVKMSE